MHKLTKSVSQREEPQISSNKSGIQAVKVVPEKRKVIKIVTSVEPDGALSTTHHNSSGGQSELSNNDEVNKFDKEVSVAGL